MVTFVALYRGKTVGDAQLVAVSTDRDLVADVSTRLLQEEARNTDPVITTLEAGRKAALRLISQEARK